MSVQQPATGGGVGEESPDIKAEEKFRIEYETVNAYILHYSSVRSALASFLITVALASFGAYYSTQAESSTQAPTAEAPWFLGLAGYLFLAAAVGASLYFSYHTERATEYARVLWSWGIDRKGPYPGGFRAKTWRYEKGASLSGSRRRQVIWREAEKDLMNWLLIIGALALGVGFFVYEAL